MGHPTDSFVHLSTFAGIVALLVACPRDPAGTGTGNVATATEPTTPTTSGTEGVTSTDATSSPTSTTDAPTTSATTSMIADLGSIGGECNLFLQDCPPEQKCTAWNDGDSFFPNGSRCVSVDPNPVGPGEICVVPGDFGDGVDNCAKGSICLDLEHEGSATCVAYCSGSMDAPKCPETEDRCSFLFEPTVPVCFPKCDPLIQDCSPAESCVPNETALGAPHFVCMPRVLAEIPGQYGDSCYALSGCEPGNLCIFAENLPNCPSVYCCSVWCDITDVEPCDIYDPTLSCVPWFDEGAATPGYENVGICAIMQ